jgi:hypothetical protein
MLQPGTRFGPYEIVGLLGVGGMGEVYRARDSRLNRDVAIKVLPELLAHDPERVARFTREAQTLAALNHPQIATVFGVEQQDRRHGLVMELVEGPTLADRLKAGAIEWREALDIARQIAEAVSAAHERGIVHRDLKPANIKLAPDGSIKVLDFGLAKALDQGSGVRGQASPDRADSPTLSTVATGAGVLLGTAPYMSPEQARGAAVDRRTDVWAFGCVLFEMLTGKQAFAGETVSDTLAAVLRAEPEWNQLPYDMPSNIDRVLRRCLTKDRKERFADLHDVALMIEEARTLMRLPKPTTRHRLRWWAVTTGAALIAAAWTFAASWRARDTAPSAEPTRFAITLPEDMRVPLTGPAASIVFSADGRSVFFVGLRAGRQPAIHRVRFDDFGVQPVNGADNASNVFISPDGQWLGIQRPPNVYRMSVAGGPPIRIPGALPGRYFWASPDRLYFAYTAGSSAGGLVYVMPAAGGEPELLRDSHGQPVRSGSHPVPVSPNTPLFYSDPDGEGQRIRTLNLATKRVSVVVQGVSPTLAGDHLAFWRDDAIWVARFDRAAAQMTHPATVAVNGVARTGAATGPALFAVSPQGHLAFVPSAGVAHRRLVWVDRKGASMPAFAERGDFDGPRLSPDGKSVAVADRTDISVLDLARGTRIIARKAARRPLWTPDGRALIFQSLASRGEADLHRETIGSSESTPPLLSQPGVQFPDSVSSDGRVIVFNQGVATRDLWLLREGKAERFLDSPANERSGTISPDGNWIVYTSDESGRDEIYLQEFPAKENKVAVSTRGGTAPLWSRAGREIFYRAGSELMTVAFDPTGPTLGPPQRLFDVSRYAADPNQPMYDVSPDAQRFLFIEEDNAQAPGEIRVILNWTEEMKRKGQ